LARIQSRGLHVGLHDLPTFAKEGLPEVEARTKMGQREDAERMQVANINQFVLADIGHDRKI
jgi:hypothetical protein